MSSKMLPILGILAVNISVATATGAAAQAESRPRFVPDEVIIQFRPSVRESSVDALQARVKAGAAGAAVRKVRLTERGTVALTRVPRGSVPEMVARFKARADVLHAEPNYYAYAPTPVRSTLAQANGVRKIKMGVSSSGLPVFRTQALPPMASAGGYPAEDSTLNQWGWWYTDSNVIWQSFKACPMVAVLDTGVDYQHPDLRPRISLGKDFINNDNAPMDDNGHGTHVAGIITAKINNAQGISGVGNGMVLAVKVLDFSGQGTYYDLQQGLDYASTNASVKVINMSLGGIDESVILRQAVYDAVYTRKKLLIAAVGNDGVNVPQYPAAYSMGDWAVTDPKTGPVTVNFTDRVLAVGAQGIWVTPVGGGADVFVEYCKASYSNYGAWVNVAAPGTEITSTTPYQKDYFGLLFGESPNGYNTYSGTSMAAPFVAAAAARVWSDQPLLTNVQVGQRLTGNDGPVFPVVMGPVDVNGDATPDLANCWDPAFAQQGAGGRAMDIADLDLAMAMRRSGVRGYAHNAYNGMALTGATAQAYLNNLVLKSASVPIGTSGVVGEDFYEILNVPWDDVYPYTIKINKAGHTVGAQPIDTLTVDSSAVWHQAREVAVPPVSTNYTFVTNWATDSSTYVEMDQHILFPTSSTTMCDVGFTPGISTDPATWCGIGSLAVAPFTRYMHDSFDSALNFETTASKSPLYVTTTQPYQAFVVDENAGNDIRDPVNGMPITRLWYGGKIKAQVAFGAGTTIQSSPACTFDGGAEICNTWHVGNLSNLGVFTPVNHLGDGVNSAVIPFARAGVAAAIPSTAGVTASISSATPAAATATRSSSRAVGSVTPEPDKTPVVEAAAPASPAPAAAPPRLAAPASDSGDPSTLSGPAAPSFFGPAAPSVSLASGDEDETDDDSTTEEEAKGTSDADSPDEDASKPARKTRAGR